MSALLYKRNRILKLLDRIMEECYIIAEQMNKLVYHNNTSNGAYDKCALRRTQLTNRFKLLYNCL